MSRIAADARARSGRTRVREHGATWPLGRCGPSATDLLLVQAAMLPVDRASDAWFTWRANHEIDEADGRAQVLLPAIARNLPAAAFGDDLQRMRGLRRRSFVEAQYRLSALHDALASLGDRIAPPLVIKGAGLLVRPSGDPSTRSLADVDVVVREADFELALARLRGDGWSPVRPRPWWGHATTLADGTGREIDLHRWVSLPRWTAGCEDHWWSRSQPFGYSGCEIRLLSEWDEAALAITHGLLAPSASSVRWPLDVHQLQAAALDAGLPVDRFWLEVGAASATLGLGGPYSAAAGLFDELFGPVTRAPSSAATARPAEPGGLDGALSRLQWWKARVVGRSVGSVIRFVRVERSLGRVPNPVRYVVETARYVRALGVRNQLGRRRSRLLEWWRNLVRS